MAKHLGHGLLPGRTAVGFLVPAMILVGLFLVVPSIWVLGISFTNYTLLGATGAHPSYVGIANYVHLFSGPDWAVPGNFGYSLYVTILFVAGSILGQAILGLAIALAFRNRKGGLRDALFTLVTLAWILPEVVVAFAWTAFLDHHEGMLNVILGLFRVSGPNWLINLPVVSIIVFNIWRGTAFSMLLFSAAIGSIPPSYLETARVIGASGWQRFRDIILPLIRGSLSTDLLLITLWTFNVFSPFLLTNGGPVNRSEIVSIYTYNIAFKFFDFGRGSAVAFIIMLINLLLALFYLYGVRRRSAH